MRAFRLIPVIAFLGCTGGGAPAPPPPAPGTEPGDVTASSGPEIRITHTVVTDAMLWAARRQLAEPVHMAMTNNGGLRIPIAPGPITVGQMFELMPFENMLSVLTLSGAQIQELADQLAAMRGEPIAGFSFRIVAEGDGRVARDALIAYVREMGIINPELEGRITGGIGR